MTISRRPAALLPGERFVAIHPPLSPDPNAGWSRRLRYHDGRALGDRALELEQSVRGARLATLAQVLSPGIVSGLEARVTDSGDDPRIRVEAGFGLTAAGQDVSLDRAIECRLGDIPIYGVEGDGEGPWGYEQLTEAQRTQVPHVLVVVLEPIRVEALDADTPGVSAADPCALDPANLAFADRQRIDGARLWLYPWPAAPAASGPFWRNHIAHAIFARQATLGPGEAAPWSRLGVPVAVFGWTEGDGFVFDRHAVARRAGRIGGRRPLMWLERSGPDEAPVYAPRIAAPEQGPWDQSRPAWWQARIDQFAEQLANEPPIPEGETLASRYRFLPPVGVLPPDAVTVRASLPGREIIPASFHLRALPIAVEALDDAVRASAGLSPFNVFVEDQMEVLVPVPQVWFEADLLVVEPVDPRFAAELAEIEALLASATDLATRAEGFELGMIRARVGPPAEAGAIEAGFAQYAADRQAELDALALEPEPDPSRRAHLLALRRAALDGAVVEDAWIDWRRRLYDGARDDLAGTIDPIDGDVARVDHMLDMFGVEAIATPEVRLARAGVEKLIAAVGDLIEQADELIDFNLLRVQASVVRFKHIFADNVSGTRLSESEAFNTLAPKFQEPAPESFDAVASTIGFGPQQVIYGNTLPSYGAQPISALSDDALREALRGAAAGAEGLDPDLVDRLDLGRLRNALTPIGRRLPSAERPRPIANVGEVDGVAGRIDFGDFNPEEPEQVELAFRMLAEQIDAFGVQGAEFYQHAAAPLVEPITQLSALQSNLLLRTVRDYRTQFDVTLPEPAAAGARDEALEARNTLIDKLIALHQAGHDLSHLDFFDGGVDLRATTPEQVKASLQALRRSVPEPDDPGDEQLVDQARSLLGGSRATEQAARLLRLVRRRTAGFKRLLRRLNAALPPLATFARDAARVRAAADAEVAELGHDKAVADALLRDEIARVDAINSRRDDIVQNRVDFLVFRRPRVVAEALAMPVERLEPANRPDPIPACLAGDYRPPPALQAMLDLLRDAPLRWFTEGPALVDRLQRLDAIEVLVEHARRRGGEQPAPRALAPEVLGAGLGLTIRALFGQRAGLLTQQRRAALAALRAARSWKAARTEALAAATLADLIDAPHGQSEATRAAAAVFGDIGEVATCLYARLRALDAVVRLEWTRLLSVFDAPLDLRRLSALPRYAELDRLDRRELQAYVDWLYGRFDADNVDARALVRDLIRYAVLLASHAPVNQLLRGAVVRPRPVAVGGRLELAVDIASTRIGAHVQLFELVNGASTLVGRGVVDDLAAGFATVRVLDASKASIEPAEGTIAEPSALGGSGWQIGPAGLLPR